MLYKMLPQHPFYCKFSFMIVIFAAYMMSNRPIPEQGRMELQGSSNHSTWSRECARANHVLSVIVLTMVVTIVCYGTVCLGQEMADEASCNLSIPG